MANDKWQQRTWKPTGKSSGFNPVYYAEQNPNLHTPFAAWKKDRATNTHWADYVRINTDLENAWLNPSNTRGYHAGQSRWDYGAWHYGQHGQNEQRLTPQIVGGPGTISGDRATMNTILTKRMGKSAFEPGVNQDAFHSWLTRHYETYGKDAGVAGSAAEHYGSPEQVEFRRLEDEDFEQKLHDEMIAQEQASTEAMEAMYAKARRVKSNNPQASGSTGQFRAKGLTSSENKRGGGSRQFRAGSPQFMATLNVPGAGKGLGSKSTLNI
tara:strand:+ start:995 stop:1798 length:804 start_codon:yes stop_codon:yes gene_type:complete